MIFFKFMPKKGKLEDAKPEDFFVIWFPFTEDCKNLWKKEQVRASGFSAVIHHFSAVIHHFSAIIHNFSAVIHNFSAVIHHFSAVIHHFSSLTIIFFS